MPVSLVYNGISHAVMMCSPKDLEVFALGFSLTEGIIEKPSDIYGIDVVEVCNGIEVQIELSSRKIYGIKRASSYPNWTYGVWHLWHGAA